MEVITVRKGQKLYEIIKEIANDKERLILVYIDSTLVESSKLVKRNTSDNYDYEFEVDGYKIIVDAGENASRTCFFLWQVIEPNKNTIYSLYSPQLVDYMDDKCECKEIFIRKRGSKTKIGED